MIGKRLRKSLREPKFVISAVNIFTFLDNVLFMKYAYKNKGMKSFIALANAFVLLSFSYCSRVSLQSYIYLV